MAEVGDSATLGERLRVYPPFTPLHLGTKLSNAQAEANFAQLVAAIPERLNIAMTFLQHEQVDPCAALAQKDPRPFLNALWDWGRLRWKTAATPWHRVRPWRDSRRDGEDILLSLLCDIGLILGEIIHGFRPEYQWAMVDDREARKRKMRYYRQPVLKIDAPRPECTPSYQLVDVIELAATSHIDADMPWLDGDRNGIHRVVSTCVLGGYELGWQGYGVIPPMQSWESFLGSREARTP